MPATEVYWAQPQAVAPDQRALLEELLDIDERARANRFAERADREAYVTAHAALRYALSRSGNRSPQAWRFRTNRAGKPELANATESQVAFSLSHTRAIVACVIAPAGPVGIDVEPFSDSAFDPSLLALCCTAAERAQLAGLAGTDRPRAFAELWTMKEAALKAAGAGLHLPMESVECALNPPRIVRGPLAGLALHATVHRLRGDYVVAVVGPGRDPARYPLAFHELFGAGAGSLVVNSS